MKTSAVVSLGLSVIICGALPVLGQSAQASNVQAPQVRESESRKKCTPGYKPCLPPASDYDCAGGSGNGPRYTGRVYVKGYDIYGLDYDRDGIGCETSSFWGPVG